MLEAARRGEAVTQYEGGGAGRNADIEAGASRDWDTLVADVRSSSARLDGVFAAQDRWDLAMTNSQGESVPHADLPMRRWREVVVHHADVGDAGFTPQDWPQDYVREDLRLMEMLYNARKPMGVNRPTRGGAPGLGHSIVSVLVARPCRHRRSGPPPRVLELSPRSSAST